MDLKVPIHIPIWGIAVTPVLIVISIIVIILITLNVKKSPQPNSEKNEGIKEWVGKRDILYWLLMISLGSIGVITYEYRNSEEVISHWGFAGTVVSIILAVVAIGFTLFQTLSSNLSSEKIADSADKIESATLNLDTTTLVESGNIMRDAADFLKREMGVIRKELTIIRDETKQYGSNWEEHFKNVNQSDINTREELVTMDDFLNKTLPKLPYFPKIFIYTFFLSINKKVEIERKMTKDISDMLINFENSDDDSNKSGKYEEGANMASMATTHSLIDHLGILNAFQKESESRQLEILGQCRKNLHEYSKFLKPIDEYLENMSK
ncbi:hypothetical protein FQ087_06150 [Sporosarcina sp. ANT_H38]|uniref:hypothetical protein n=1 Tax=Sporosarcina sp. ANT_H38 TaxID=2597358 RepID=UPI0011F2B294|nr:hypothetical protein [Sporosarcina sp. ANT_H38]KAA0965846.1 hypothetical protein FQ087_06150 [Sporosarcina sp. ANT_H38]